ncbi:MAG TPA: ribbon-helix-helix domain-containing protein [Candidatus Krumholzibacteria bacterium]|nr:ribbon-helix-helix domain-containing protein [Candidatus Krumholzibacteria bacterium]
MKTAISIPDNLFKAAEQLARRLGISRSELFQRAIADYLGGHSADVVRETLDSVYGDPANRQLDPLVQAAALQILSDEAW